MFENELENIENMYMKMAIHTMHTDTITKHAYICICATFTIHAYIYYMWIFMTIHRCMDTDHTTCTNTCVYNYK